MTATLPVEGATLYNDHLVIRRRQSLDNKESLTLIDLSVFPASIVPQPFVDDEQSHVTFTHLSKETS
jgi:hypothetical protein